MATVRIDRLTDYFDNCETCGSSYAEGYIVFVDGEGVICKEPVAHCFGGQSFSEDDLLEDILNHFGHKLEHTISED